MFTDKVASVEDVDRAVMIHLRMPAGIFGMLDRIGLDTIWHVMESNAKMSGDPGAQQFADEFKRHYIDKGWLGVKSGRGFYTYPDPGLPPSRIPGRRPRITSPDYSAGIPADFA